MAHQRFMGERTQKKGALFSESLNFNDESMNKLFILFEKSKLGRSASEWVKICVL